jgi:leucine dehydrogenase
MSIDENNSVFEKIKQDNHEQLVFCNDESIGLKAIIGIHNTSLGPAIGGTRMWNYASYSIRNNYFTRAII